MITSGWPVSSATEREEQQRTALEIPIQRKLSVGRHNKEFLPDKTMQWSILQVIQHGLIGLGHQASEPVNLKRPHRVCSASTATFQLARLIQVENANSRGDFLLSRPTGRPGTTEEGFCAPRNSYLALMASEGFLPVNLVTSLFREATTLGSRATHSVDLWPEGRRISWAYWCSNNHSARVLFQRSTTSWSLWILTRPCRTWTECFASSWLTAPMNSRPGSTWRSFTHRKGLRL